MAAAQSDRILDILLDLMRRTAREPDRLRGRDHLPDETGIRHITAGG